MDKIQLTNSEGYWTAYELGDKLEKVFPDQDIMEFLLACEHNSSEATEISDLAITEFKMLQQGEHDCKDWIWRITTEDGSEWVAIGGCDYTGWDCQSWLDIRRFI